MKPSNILVNFGSGADRRFADAVLADCDSAVHVDSSFAREGKLIGAAIFRSPEAHLQLRWSTSTDIWSFGTTVKFFSLPLSPTRLIFYPIPHLHTSLLLFCAGPHTHSFSPFCRLAPQPSFWPWLACLSAGRRQAWRARVRVQGNDEAGPVLWAVPTVVPGDRRRGDPGGARVCHYERSERDSEAVCTPFGAGDCKGRQRVFVENHEARSAR